MIQHLLRLSALVFFAPALCAQDCAERSGGFHLPGADDLVRCSAVVDRPAGPVLYVGGQFHTVGEALSRSVARWDGTHWSSLAGGVQEASVEGPIVWALLAVGDKLYVGGSFDTAGGIPAHNLAVWDGQSWSAVPNAPDDDVRALAIDQGRILVGGTFTHVGGLTARGIASLDPITNVWSAVGDGTFFGEVHAFARLATAQGSQLLVGGLGLSLPGFVAGEALLYWDGMQWHRPGPGIVHVGGVSAWVDALLVRDEGSGPRVWVGGAFDGIGSLGAGGIAEWDGANWTVPFNTPGGVGVIRTLHEHDFGSGLDLYIGGEFMGIGGQPFAWLARWNGFATMNSGANLDERVLTLTDFDGELVAGGEFGHDGTNRRDHLAVLDGSTTLPVSRGNGLPGTTVGLCSHDDGNGALIYAISSPGYTSEAFVPSPLSRWNGINWESVLTPAQFVRLYSMHSHDEGAGTGAALFVAGPFQDVAGVPANGVARWSGGAWSALEPVGVTDIVALESFDEGAGASLFAGGFFTTAGGQAAHGIARWDGTAWSAVGGGLDGYAVTFTVFDDGSGPALYAGGTFQQAGATAASRVARWDGQTWSALGTGILGDVYALTPFDDGSGPALIAAGQFSIAGGTVVRNVARWQNGTWSAMGDGLGSGSSIVKDLTQFDDGNGPTLYATGSFKTSGVAKVVGLARWTGTAWEEVAGGLLSSGVTPAVAPDGGSLCVADDGHGSALFVGGTFVGIGDTVSNGIVRYHVQHETGAILCAGDGSGAACPCANDSAAGTQQGCVNSLGTGGRLRLEGCAQLSIESAVLSTHQVPDGPCLYVQSTIAAAGGAGFAFGDGLLCAAGSIDRLAVVFNTAGASSLPPAGQKLSTLCGIASATTRVYQVWYRDAVPYCAPASFNLTNGVEVNWIP